jgi:4-amino-4-deoxy-L-arabinose transferase-like glycosyltransferase
MALRRQALRPRPAGPAEGELVERSRQSRRTVGATLAAARRVPEVAVLVSLAGVLDLWALGQNGWANTYYSAAVRSMAGSWHDFLFASFDPSGVMTVDKPPLSLWIQALSVRIFGFHPLAILVPQALMGIVAVVLVYDLVRRRFGRAGGFVAGLALATTPIAVAMSRHNNPDMLLTLLCTLAVWFAVRATEDGRTRWLVWSGVAVCLAFEAKMGEALVVVPAITLAWLWLAPRGRLTALRQLLAGGAAMLVVGAAWPVLVWLTPAADRPYVSGTADNSIWSLIFGYNGLGRINGQAGGPAGRAGGVFAGTNGVLRLLGASLGGEDGWLIGLAIGGALLVLLATRGRRRDPRTVWVAIVGGSFLVTGVLFSIAHGIFHPYYVVLLSPFEAALAGAGVGTLLRGDERINVPIASALVLVAGTACELVVRDNWTGQLRFLEWMLPVVCGLAAITLFLTANPRVQATAIGLAVAALLIAPTIWAFDTLGYPTQGTFPAGGPAVDNAAGGRLGADACTSGTTGAGAAAPFGGSAADLAPALAYAKAHGGGTVAVREQSGDAACAIIQDGADVAGIGGFSGQESDPSVAWLATEVATGNIRFVDTTDGGFGGGFGGRLGGGFPGFGGGFASPGGSFGAAPATGTPLFGGGGGGGGGGAGRFGRGRFGGHGGAFGPGAAGGTGFAPGGSATSGFRPGAAAIIAAAEQACTAVKSSTVSGLYDCAGKAAALRALATTR